MSPNDQQPPRIPRSRRSLTPGTSLHEIGGLIQLKYLESQAQELLQGLDEFIATTERCAPVRKQPYPLVRKVAGTPRGEESRWERAIWQEWRDQVHGASTAAICSRIVSYQVMLRDTNQDRAWGEIDLLGESPEHLPVVIELKGATSGETPLRGIVEAVAYAIAVRKAWSVCLREQWCDALGLTADHSARSVSPLMGLAVFAAPVMYWNRVLGRSGPRGRVSADTWRQILKLCDACADRGLPVSLVALDAIDVETPGGITGRVLPVVEIVSSK